MEEPYQVETGHSFQNLSPKEGAKKQFPGTPTPSPSIGNVTVIVAMSEQKGPGLSWVPSSVAS